MAIAGAILPCAPAAAGAWEPLPRLRDVRFEGARDVAPEVRATGSVRLALPWAASVDGHRVTGATVGAGWIRFDGGEPLAASFDGTVRPVDPGASSGARIDVLAGPAIRVGDEARVLVQAAPDGFAVRWAPVTTPAGPAVVEVLLDRGGAVATQFLHVPPALATLQQSGAVRSDAGEAVTARSYRLVGARGPVLVPVPALPDPRPLPAASGPPPAGCVPEVASWCERADGPGTSVVFLNENFETGGPGWMASGLWHLNDWATCAPGASFNPGTSVYFGDDAACSYPDFAAGSLFSPPFGPVTATTQFTFQSRIEYEQGFDLAEVWIDDGPGGAMPLGLAMPSLDQQWYTFNPIVLDAFVGRTVQIEFRFQADDVVVFDGWWVDDVVAWDPAVGNPGCVVNAGHADRAACDARVSTRWGFNEGAFCAGCAYTFYVLVECGREMHLPLLDMEGADIRVTNVATGAPVPLRCVNDTARVDANGGTYPGFTIPSGMDLTGPPLDCCPPNGAAEIWWAPAFDVTDNAGPGHVRWGLDQNCPSVAVYDTGAPAGIECAELPPTCGGPLPNLTPGESQVMDCFISDDAGLCGLYRVDVVSGGFVWDLFANCDGTGTPQFQIFFDCTEAWTAFNPLPELAIADLVVTDGCPNLTVSFDVVNIGCVDHPGDVLVRLTTDCVPADSLDHLVVGPVPAGGTVPQVVAFTASCSPVRVEVFSDPDDTIAECTESAGVAACRAEAGVDSLAAFTCGCTAQLTAEAGADVSGCQGDTLQLDGAGSVIAPCAQPEYRWLDGTGAVVQDWGIDSSVAVSVVTCPSETYTLEVRCAGEPCVDSDTVVVGCIQLTASAGADALFCDDSAVTLDGSASVVTNCTTPEYRWFDPLGNEVRPWSPDPTVNLGPTDCAAAGSYQLEVRCAGVTSCSVVDDVVLSCVQVTANGGPDATACENVPFTLTPPAARTRNCSSVVYQWFDATTGMPISGVLSDPTLTASFMTCPGTARLALAAACADVGFETCGSFDLVDVVCTKPTAPVPVASRRCDRQADLACGVAEAGVTYSWDVDVTVDSDGDMDPANDADLTGCNAAATWPAPGPVTARAWAQDANGCRTSADLPVDVLGDVPDAAPTAVPACAGMPSQLSCGAPVAGLTYAWDFDVATDSDGNTVPDDDVDATTCDAAQAYGPGTTTAELTVREPTGCQASATVDVVVAPGAAPAEVTGDRVTKAGSALRLAWDVQVDAATFRVSRGDIGDWYSHAADDPTGRGTCDTAGAVTFTDPDDAAWGSGTADWYYLITAVSDCGVEGTAGYGHDGDMPFERDRRLPTPSCP